MTTTSNNTKRNGVKIAILRALYLGDMLCIIPAVRAIRTAFMDAHITLIGLPWQTEFMERFSHYFDEFMRCPGLPGLIEQPLDATGTVDFLRALQQRNFDFLFQMQGNGSITNAMCMLSGAGTVLGLRSAGEFCPDARLFPVSPDDEHEILRFLKLVDALNIPRCGVDLELPVTQEENMRFESLCDALALTPGRYICLHPGARDPRRRWPAAQFARIGDALHTIGYKIVLTGSGAEKELLQQVAVHMEHDAIDVVAQCGHIGLGELSLLIGHAAFLVANDTGVSHIAAARRVPSLILFSDFSLPSRWAPLDATIHQTMSFHEAVSPEAVVARVTGFLDHSPVRQISFSESNKNL
jgi:ADP-heptose:LPS heptosyltransferase